ncbi:MAG: uvrD [Candidatus Nomurabacteria bacterium]|nr:uvrD [Candidatus Nomurabacteria bacterium]
MAISRNEQKSDLDRKFDARYKSLNEGQKKAVDTTDGPVMVIAGPGSGKTELLSLRVGKILKEGRARAYNILCLTFTETAALNMRERLENLIGADAYRVAIYTFHGFCTDIIGRYPEYFFEATHFRPASDLIQSEILKNIFERLEHKHVLGGYHPERGYAYLKEAQGRIKDIKKGGLSPDRFKEILEENEKALVELNKILSEHLPERIGKDSISAFEVMRMEFEKSGTNIGSMYAKSIENALTLAEATEKNTPLSGWKTEYTGKDEDGNRVFKDFLSLSKLYALVDIYKMYQKALYKEGYFDYEDMILQVVDALSKNETLRTEIEELYHYIMVDEFQDTNNAQLELVKALSSNPVHEGRPNVCVVGDDDQAIYRFQGAEISNIHSFSELYKDVERIVLIENYRSTQKILDFARAIVTQGVNRLETIYKDVRKDLKAKNKDLPVGEIHTCAFGTDIEEYAYTSKKIQELLQNGVPAKEIAVIAREHRQLISILPYMDKLNVPYTYTRKENVFDEVHVKELITLCRFLSTVGGEQWEKDEYLPEILSFPFWGLGRISIWKVAENAKRENISWLEAMEKSTDEKMHLLAQFLIELGTLSQTIPLEIILDALIGSKDIPRTPESENEDEEPTLIALNLESPFTSPYKEYYFGKSVFKENPASYIHFLSSLRVFMQALRNYKEGTLLLARDVGEFVDMHVDYNIPLINETPFAHNENSVSLLTSHSAKGLEFDYVFIISVNDDIWAGRPKGNKLSFPINLLGLKQTGDEEDDFIRLFYVAITRARHTLYITHHKSPLRFLSHPDLPDTDKGVTEVEQSELLAEGLQVYHIPPFAKDEKALLKKVIEGYMLPPTHLNNFLNVMEGGPLLFLEQNLLRFPQAKSVSNVYGTAIHKAIEDAHILIRKDGAFPDIEKVFESFRKELKKGRLPDYEEEKQRKRGERALEKYIEIKKDEIKAEDIVELNFAKQCVQLDGSYINGKIDKIVKGDNDSWTVIDLKTGRGYDDWDEGKTTVYDKIKLHHYRYQLMFYKILVENSRDHNTHEVKKGCLEFVEQSTGNKIQELSLSFEDKNILEEVKRLEQLIMAVYKKICALDFPDTSKYEKSLVGIKEFEEDLIQGNI